MRARWHWLIPAVVIGGLVAPIPLSDETFASDWGNHLWLIWVQGLSIENLGLPTYYLQFTLGAFYPYFAFYGGSMYAGLGLVSSWLGPSTAVALAYVASLAAAYLGWTWIARQAGLRGWIGQLPGCIAVTAPYAVSNLYGRGDIPEAIATAMIPLVAAAAISILREPRVTLRSAALYVAGIGVLTGTHTLTLVWGMTFLALGAVLLAVCNWGASKARVRRGLTLISLTVLGLGVNAWILMPLTLYHRRLYEDEPDPIGFTGYTAPKHLFSLLRDSGGIYPKVEADVNTQLPVLALVWALACSVLYWRFFSRRDKRLALGAFGLFAAFLVLILAPSLIEELPRVWRFIQFPYRLLTYTDFALVGLITIVLVALQRAGSAGRRPVLLLGGIAALSFGLSIGQNLEARSWLSGREEALRSQVEAPPTWYAPLQFADGSARVVRPTLPRLPLRVPAVMPGQDSFQVTYPPGPAGTVSTNIVTGTYFVELVGARHVGRGPHGEMVIGLPASSDPRQVEIRGRWGSAVDLGRWLSLVSLLVALAWAGFVATRRVRARRATVRSDS